MNEGSTTKMNPAKTLAKGHHRAERAFARIDRYAAWLSALLLFLFFVSGFGMTKPDLVHRMTGGLMTWRVAYDLHNSLFIPLMSVFIIHTFTGVRRAMLRKTTKSRRGAAWVAGGLGSIVPAYLLFLALSPSGL